MKNTLRYILIFIALTTIGIGNVWGVTVTIGAGGTYPTLFDATTGVFPKINDGTLTGVIVLEVVGNISESAESAALVKLNPSGTGGANYSSITIIPTGVTRTISGTYASPLIDLSLGADSVTIDGRLNGSGTPNSLIISNTSTSNIAGTSTIRFGESAQNNTIKYCTILGSETNTASGIIFFSTSTSTPGNDNNVIEYNEITCAGTNRPINAIYSVASATTGTDNSGNTIRNNKIYNFLKHGTASNGIQLAAYNTNWTITGNSFYEEASFTSSSTAAYNVIWVNSTNSSNITMNGNYIGGSAAACSGTWIKTGSNNIFTAININSGATASNINSNTIKGIDWTNSSNASWTGINIVAGAVNIGTTVGNRIGGGTGNDSIKVTGTGGVTVYGINIASTGTVDCQNNIIGAINSANTSTSNASNLYGINKTGTTGITTISYNTIGSTSTSNSMHSSSTATGQNQTLMGIKSAGTGDITISNNTISNLTNACTNEAGSSQVVGISTTAGNNTISNNTINTITSYTGNAEQLNIKSSTIGIILTAGGTNSVYSNTIYNLNNEYSGSFAGNVLGLFLASTTGSTLISKNFIHTLSILNPNPTSAIAGIKIDGTTQTLYNNIVNLNTPNATNLYGILDNTGISGSIDQTTKIYFNTIFIGGTNDGTEMSYALYSAYESATSCIRDYRNNIFFNERINNGTDYGIYYSTSDTTDLTTDFNAYYVTGTNGKIGYNAGADLLNLAAIQFATGQDRFSEHNHPKFNQGSTTYPYTNANYYKIGKEFVGIAETGLGVSDDFGGVQRGTYSVMGAWDGTINKWKGNISEDWNNSANWTADFVPADSANIVFDELAERNCVQDQNRIVMHIFNSTNQYTVVNGKKLTLIGNLSFGASAKINASATNSNLEYKGEEVQIIPSASLVNDEVYNLTINSFYDLILNGTLRLLNTLTATSGKLDAYKTSPTVSYAGTTAQSISTATYLDDKATNLIVDNAAGVTLNTDFTIDNNLTINSGKTISIAPSKLLTVNTTSGTITNDAGTSGLVIKASPTLANGSLIFKQGLTVPATVEMYSKASWNASLSNSDNNKYKWQFFGIPVSTVTAIDKFAGGYVRKWVEIGTSTSNHWISLLDNETLSPFIGYEICQLNPKTYSFTGNLVSSNFSKTVLAYTSGALYPGQHIFANPYTAAIRIASLSGKFGSNMEAAVYLYNTGSFNEWYNTTNTGETVANTGTGAGQYTVSTPATVGQLGVPTQIPSMQAFLVKAKSNVPANNSLVFNYKDVVGKNTELQRAPSTRSNVVTRIDVRSTHFSDKMWIFTDSTCTRNYDRGWDGSKLFGSARTPQIFAIEPDGKYQINAVADMNNTDIGFQAGEEKEFTMKFTHENADSYYTNITLYDIVAKTSTDITVSGTEYKFTAEPNTPASKRFKIITSNVKTNESASKIKVYSVDGMVFVQNSSDENGELKLYDVSGRFIQQTSFGANNSAALMQRLTPGVYLAKTIINGKEITKSLIVR